MKKISKTPRLLLNRQIVRQLKLISKEDLGQVNGASDFASCSFGQDNNCTPH